MGLVENDYKTNLSKMIECEDNGTFTSLSFSKKPKLNHKWVCSQFFKNQPPTPDNYRKMTSV